MKKEKPKLKDTIPPKYYRLNGKSLKIPKIIYGQHPDVIKMYFTIPVSVRLRWKQCFTKATEKFNFGPLKGKQFRYILKNKDEDIKLYYRNKIFLASANEDFVQKIADYYNPYNALPPELEIRVVYIN